MSNNPIGIPNITINGSDYWETHKSEYNALIGNPVGTFKIDLSSYNTTANTLYAWDDSENSSITYYTTSENPQVGDPVLNSSGELYETNYHVSRLITNGFEVSAS